MVLTAGFAAQTPARKGGDDAVEGTDFGAGGLGRVVLDILRQAGRHRPVAFLDSDPLKHRATLDDVPVAGNVDRVDRLIRAGVSAGIVAIGDNHTRVAVAEQLRRRGLNLVSAIHPLVSISPTAILSEHLIIGPRVTICVHAHIGEFSKNSIREMEARRWCCDGTREFCEDSLVIGIIFQFLPDVGRSGHHSGTIQ